MALLYSDAVSAYSPLLAQEEKDRERMLACIALFPNVLTRENEIMHFTASCWIANEARSRVLMAYHNQYDSWAWTGGHADGDGDLLRVALREAREETGLADVRAAREEPISLEILGVDGHWKRGAYVSAHLHLNVTYLLIAGEDERLSIKPDENSAVRWMTPEEALERTSERAMRPVYQKCIDRMRSF